MNIEDIEKTILSAFREKEVMNEVGIDDDFFDLGVSSLTIVELQIVVEKMLGLEVPTSTLMAAPTIAEWVSVYTEAAKANTSEAATVA